MGSNINIIIHPEAFDTFLSIWNGEITRHGKQKKKTLVQEAGRYG
jgi:hypothetical protein